MLLLDGQAALSPFRIDRLNARLEAAGLPVRVLAARFLYLVDAGPLGGVDADQVLGILEATGPAAPLGADERLVVPRLGTLSPWSSKATEILVGCGLPVRRVERGTRVAMTGLDGADAGALAAALAIVSDPMTESVLASLDAAPRVFERGEPGPLGHVALGPDPVAALADANRALGLALSPDEIEYLAAHYGRLKRDPTDAELMMFAQANSEHCRHKVFNAGFTIDGVPQASRCSR